MANEKNLKPNNKRTPSERRENARKAGKASGEARRKRKALKENMEILLNLSPDKRTINKLKTQGITEDGLDNATALTFALLKKGLEGDVKAFIQIRDLIGEDNNATEVGELEGLMQGLKDEV